MRTGWTARTTNGRVTNASATARPAVVALVDPDRAVGTVERHSTMLATMVGRAKGRSIRALTRLLPRKSSRTRTQATRVPMTLTRATTADVLSVTRRAARAAGAVTASQNSPRPPDSAVNVIAASGSRTITLSPSRHPDPQGTDGAGDPTHTCRAVGPWSRAPGRVLARGSS